MAVAQLTVRANAEPSDSCVRAWGFHFKGLGWLCPCAPLPVMDVSPLGGFCSLCAAFPSQLPGVASQSPLPSRGIHVGTALPHLPSVAL